MPTLHLIHTVTYWIGLRQPLTGPSTPSTDRSTTASPLRRQSESPALELVTAAHRRKITDFNSPDMRSPRMRGPELSYNLSNPRKTSDMRASSYNRDPASASSPNDVSSRDVSLANSGEGTDRSGVDDNRVSPRGRRNMAVRPGDASPRRGDMTARRQDTTGRQADTTGRQGDGTGRHGDGAGRQGDGTGRQGDGTGRHGDGLGRHGDGSGRHGDVGVKTDKTLMDRLMKFDDTSEILCESTLSLRASLRRLRHPPEIALVPLGKIFPSREHNVH